MSDSEERPVADEQRVDTTFDRNGKGRFNISDAISVKRLLRSSKISDLRLRALCTNGVGG